MFYPPYTLVKACGGVVCSPAYGGYCLARRSIVAAVQTSGMWAYTKPASKDCEKGTTCWETPTRVSDWTGNPYKGFNAEVVDNVLNPDPKTNWNAHPKRFNTWGMVLDMGADHETAGSKFDSLKLRSGSTGGHNPPRITVTECLASQSTLSACSAGALASCSRSKSTDYQDCDFGKESSSRYIKVTWAGWTSSSDTSGNWQRSISGVQIRRVPRDTAPVVIKGTCGPDTAAAIKKRKDTHKQSPCMAASTAAGCLTATHGPVRDTTTTTAAVYTYTRAIVPEVTGVGLPCNVTNVTFGDPIVARYLRIRAVDWVGTAPSMRVSLHGCEDAVPQATINGTKDQPGMSNNYTDPAKATMDANYSAAEAQIVSFEETLEMDDTMTAVACQAMVANCNCNDATTKIGDFGLTYACDNAKCCMTKKGQSVGDEDQTRFCNDESFCDNDDNYRVVVNDDGDVNGWATTAHGAASSTATNRWQVDEYVPASTTFKTESHGTLHGPFGRGLASAANMWVEKSFKLQKHKGITIVARIWLISTFDDKDEHVWMNVDGTGRYHSWNDRGKVGKISDGWHLVDKHFEDTTTSGTRYATYKDISWADDSHTAESATIRFGSSIDQGMSDESWAFSELTILLRTNRCGDQFRSGSSRSPRAGTMFTGSSINSGTPLPMSLSSDLGDNEWLVGVMDGGGVYLKMSKITITGASSYTWIATKHTGSPTTACKVQATFNEACFVGTVETSEVYPLTLVAAETTALFLEEASPARRMPSVVPAKFLEEKAELRGVAPARTEPAAVAGSASASAAAAISFLQVGSKTRRAVSRYNYYGPGRRIVNVVRTPEYYDGGAYLGKVALSIQDMPWNYPLCKLACPGGTYTSKKCCLKSATTVKEGMYKFGGAPPKHNGDGSCVHVGSGMGHIGDVSTMDRYLCGCYRGCAPMTNNGQTCPGLAGDPWYYANKAGYQPTLWKRGAHCGKNHKPCVGPGIYQECPAVYMTVESKSYSEVKTICDDDSTCKGFSFASAGRMLDTEPSQDSGTTFLLFNRLRLDDIGSAPTLRGNFEADAEWSSEPGDAKYHMYVIYMYIMCDPPCTVYVFLEMY